jgi:protein-tyrosine phosphatase
VRLLLVIVLLFPLAGCQKKSAPPVAESAQPAAPPPAATSRPASARLSISKPEPAATPHLHNLLHLTDRIYSGGEPHGEAAFAELAKLGVKLIVSVDGAKPDVENAKKHGLRYVHIPIGYDGIPAEAGQSLARVVREANAEAGSIYVHCHHGKHRGPAAAAALCIAAGAANNDEAKAILVTAGTSKDYPGLWRDVAAYVKPPRDAQLPRLVEIANVNSLTAAMSNIDRSFDNLKLAQTGNWQALPEHPDFVAAQEAVILKESLHESARNLSADRDAEFMAWLREAESLTTQLEGQLKSNDSDGAKQTMIKLEASCKQCHTKHRN